MRKLIPMALLLTGGVFASPALAELGTPAGVAGAVTGSVGLTSPAKQITAPVAVASGDGIVMGDNLSTGTDSRLQVMLLDESAITLGPDADLTIDEFVFDPANTNANALAASLLKGTFRLVTGGVARQNPEGTSVNLPNAVLTIRGTTVMGSCAATCVIALAGSGDANTAAKKPSTVTLKSAKGEVTLKRQRFASLFPPADSQQANLPTGSLIDGSGQPTQEGNPLAENQREFEGADQLDGNDTFETTSNLPVSKINYESGAIGFAGGSGDGDYYVSYTLDLAARDFKGSVFVDHTDNSFQTSFPLTQNPFEQGLSLSQGGALPGGAFPDGVYNFDYIIGTSGIDTTFSYDQDGPLTAPSSTGAGNAPAVP